MKNKQSKQKEFTIPVHILLKKILKTNRGNWKSTYITWLFVMIETVCETLVTFFLSLLIAHTHIQRTSSLVYKLYFLSSGSS